MIRIADYIMSFLSNMGVKNLYMVTGRGNLYLSDAAAKCDKINCISMHHEQSCAFAAYASAIATNNVGACLVSTGCAGTNAITGLLCAWQDDIPVVFISGQNTLKETTRFSGDKIKTWGQQETDIISIVKSLTKYAVMIDSAERSVYEIEKAVYLSTHGRKGPVWIDIPIDVQNMRIEPDNMEHFTAVTEKMTSFNSSEIKSMLESANRPVVLIGSGIKSANAENELIEFIEKNQIPVAYSASAPDIIGYDHPLCVGSLGMMACRRSAAFAVQNSDLLLVIGNRLSPMTTGSDYSKFAREAKVVVIDIDENEHKKNTIKIDTFIKSDAKVFLMAMLSEDINANYTKWVKQCDHWKKIFPIYENEVYEDQPIDLYYLAEVLSDLLPEESTLLTDAGLEELILPANVCFSQKRRCIHPSSQGTMGFALPASVGAYLSVPMCTVAVVGDGSFMMNIQELATIAYHRLPIKIIIINNDLYAVIRKRQRDLFRKRTVGTDAENGVGAINLKKLADCHDIKYMRIDMAKDLPGLLHDMLECEEPVICEVLGLENQSYTSTAYARTISKRFVQRPLEDQSPFLDRELFLSEMIIDPIDQ